MADDDCRSCLNAVGELRRDVGEMKGLLTSLNDSIMKIFYALIALAGASIGTKFIGTPWYVEIAMWATMSSGLFVGLITLAKRKCLSFWEKWIRWSFVCYCFWVSGLRIYHYQVDTPLTRTEGIVSQMILTSLAVGFITLAWRRTQMRKDEIKPDRERRRNESSE